MKRKCQFLVVDDNKIDQLVTRQLLKNILGISDISQVSNGMEALEWIKINKEKLNDCLIILLDIKMPEMDGFSFLDAFDKLDDRIKKITRVLMVSSTLDPMDIERAENHKYVKKMLTKPLPITELKMYLASLG